MHLIIKTDNSRFSRDKLFTSLWGAVSSDPSFGHFILYMLLYIFKLTHFLMIPSDFLLAIIQNFCPKYALRFKLSKIFTTHHKQLSCLAYALDRCVIFFTHGTIFISNQLAFTNCLEFYCFVLGCDILYEIFALTFHRFEWIIVHIFW
jgi:hypothetical protein